VGAHTIDAYSGLKYESSVLAYQAAIQGDGVAIAQKVLVEDDLAAGRLVAPFDFWLDMGRNTYYLVFPTRTTNSPELTLFREWLQTACSSADDQASIRTHPPSAVRELRPSLAAGDGAGRQA
jgi:LysR family transcriptional regulator, glycine cleavage system transcriptional activator